MWIENFEMLFLSVVRIARLVTEAMRYSGGGVIVNISACDFHEQRQNVRGSYLTTPLLP
jgi:NAD(P)-dependent dehydrogenase (short-subunit alcohol dehydrogenase family)